MASRERLAVLGDVPVPVFEQHISVERFLGISYSMVDAVELSYEHVGESRWATLPVERTIDG